MENNKIFIQIASYRDSECKYTIDDIFTKAKNPDLIFIGLNWQYALEDNDIPFFNKQYKKNIRIVEYDYTKAEGVCWARSKTQELYQDEKYTLSIDAHMRFVKNWDEILINMIKKLQKNGYKKPVITHYPPDYTLDNKFGKTIKRMAPFLNEKDSLFVFRRTGHEIQQNTSPMLSSCIAAGFHFTLSSLIKEVPYDPNLYFLGEEISLAVRMWTHGYDFFNPDQIITFHLYKEKTQDDGSIAKSRNVKLNQNDNDMSVKNAISKARVRHILGTCYSDDKDVLKDIDKFSLGKERTLHQFELFSGINFQTLQKRAFTRASILFENMIPLGLKDEKKLLKKYSKEPKNFTLNSELINTLNCLNINSIVHVGCGFQNTALNKIKSLNYTGIDYNEDIIDCNNMLYGNNQYVNFIYSNYINTPLFYADLTYIDININNSDIKFVWQLLKNLQTIHSNFIATSEKNNILLDIPFNLPEPNIIIPFSNTKLYIWHYEKLIPYLDGLNNEESYLRKQLYEKIDTILDLFEDSDRKNIISSLPIQSLSKARELIFTPQFKQSMELDIHLNKIINNIIDLRFQRLNKHTREIFPFVNEKNKLLVMILICEYCEIQCQFLNKK